MQCTGAGQSQSVTTWQVDAWRKVALTAGRCDTEQARLPTVDERPTADVVIYDGECAFCRDQVARLAGWDRGGRLAFISLHDPRVRQWYPDLSHEALMQQMYIVDRRGRRHGGAAALRYLSRRLPRLWWLAPWLHIPGSLPWWQAVYRWVARRRYRLWAGRVHCDSQQCATRFAVRSDNVERNASSANEPSAHGSTLP